MADDQHAIAHSAATPPRTDYTVHKGEVSLAVYRKHLDKVSGGATATATELEQAATQTVVPRPINFKR